MSGRGSPAPPPLLPPPPAPPAPPSPPTPPTPPPPPTPPAPPAPPTPPTPPTPPAPPAPLVEVEAMGEDGHGDGVEQGDGGQLLPQGLPGLGLQHLPAGGLTSHHLLA